MSTVARFAALYDACVLYPATMRDFLMSLAETDLFRARWTDRIHDEWIRNVLRDRTDLTRERLERTRDLMNGAVPDCLITDFDALIGAVELPDPDDRHVLAAAIRGRVDVIVTLNLKDFPATSLAPYDIDAQHPDAFADHLLNLNAGAVCAAAKRHRERLKKPPKTAQEYLDALANTGFTRTAAGLLGYVDVI